MLEHIFICQRFGFFQHGRQWNIEFPLVGEFFFKPFNIPLFFNRLFRHIGSEHVRENTVTQGSHQLRRIGQFQQLVTLLVNDLALVIGDIVIFQQLLAHVEVAAFDFPLRRFNRTCHDTGFDRFAFRHLQAFHNRTHLVTGKNTQQRIVQRQIKTG